MVSGGMESLTANEAAAKRTTAARSAAPKVAAVMSPASTEKAAAMQTAVAKPAVGPKRKEPSLPTLLTARACSGVDPVGIDVAKKVALQGAKASPGEINPEG